ncbi:heme exporter protein C [Pseudarcicella hirudinis]|uniref:Heme exporter protein C n=1 Tax=Pseudarcicella hirudinis TaxID=1079859 RepID=A0A1I5XMM5_9BACT|nr:cytochrome c biogenesis protein [Pseudarcicella hirudinis]SFQ33225.1 heme exporter protein C [Pseudarcicella hirudinis]
MKNWWKILSVVLLMYVMIMGFLGEVPRQPILNESVRNLYFHVTMWFSMMALLITSVWYSVKYLRNPLEEYDDKAVEFAYTGILFGVLGLITGSLWARFTWGAWWTNDPKLNSVAIGMLIYFAYIILRGSFQDELQRGRISAVYNIFAFVIFMVLIWILPRMTDSLHPGNGGNPGFKPMDTKGTMQIVFRPAIVGWILLGVWITTLRLRLKKLERIQKEL